MRSRLALVALLPLATASAWGQSIDLASAETAFHERQKFCDRDRGALWGQNLCGPLFFVDPKSRNLVANQDNPRASLQRRGDVWTGRLPDNILVANTAVDWGGMRWSMVQWPLPKQQTARDTLLLHESWHRIQESLGLPPRSPTEAHLATVIGRTTMRMEWRALAEALVAGDNAGRRHAIRDALIFRAWRRQSTAEATDLEDQLELNEGLAEYTGRRLSGQAATDIAKNLAKAEHAASFVRSFAYASGPAYGFLLDLFSTNWRKQLTPRSDLGEMLAVAADVSLPKDIGTSAKIAGIRYGLAAVDQEERAAAHEREMQASKWTLQLVRGPVLRLPFASMKIEFNPNNLFPLPPYGTVYPTLQVIDLWGTLVVSGGALIDGKWRGVAVSAPSHGELKANGWSLKLNPGWALGPGKRPGDLVVARTS